MHPSSFKEQAVSSFAQYVGIIQELAEMKLEKFEF